MWNEKKSLTLSKICIFAFAIILIAVLATGPWLVAWLLKISVNAQPQYTPLFLTTLYSGGLVALFLLVYLYQLIASVAKGQVFCQKVVAYLRKISWCCFIGAGIAALSMLYYLPWGMVALAAAFVGLIVRVVKNIIAQAILLKEENDYTI